MLNKGPWLGQIPLILGPSSWGAGAIPLQVGPPVNGIPPYYGEWGVVDEATGSYTNSGRIGPFNTIEEAFQAAGKAAGDAGARRMPLDGFAQVVDSTGQAVGPII